MKLLKLAFAVKIAVTALVLTSAGVCIFAPKNAYATPYGNEITKYDGINPNGLGLYYEDNETEFGMVQSQVWDLEGFFLKGSSLTIVGGYNFYTGLENMKAGDIFIDTNDDAVYSPNTIPSFNYNPSYKEVSNSLFKYDYVLDINWVDGTFNIVKLNDSSMLKDTLYGEQYNKPSNPWIYVSGGDVTYTGSFNTYGKSTQTDTGFSGWNGNNSHYAATFDISAIDLRNGGLFHNTMECGNDNLIGQTASVPEPGTMMLLGFGMLGLAIYGKRRMNKEV